MALPVLRPLRPASAALEQRARRPQHVSLPLRGTGQCLISRYSTKEAFFLEAYPEALSKAPRQLQMIMRSLAKLRGPERPDYLFIAMQLLRMKEDLKVNAVGPYEWQVEKVCCW